MNNQINKLIPEFRFPEFVNEGEWVEDIIENIVASESSSVALNKLELKNEGFPVYGADSIVGYINNYQHENEYISIVKDGSGVGRLNLCESKSTILGTLTALKSKDNKKYNLNWIYYLLNTVDLKTYIKGSGIPHIYYSDYKKEKVLVPRKTTEQEKIAHCLSSLDEVMTALSDKLESLKTYKKGLMQNLFPQKGEKVPKLRYKEFEKNGDWEFLNGNELFDTISNKNHNSNLPILAITQELGAIPRDLINYNVVVTEKSVESYKVIDIGDFIISLRSFQGGIEYSNYKGICSPAYIILRKKNEYSENEFYKHYFKTDLYIRNLNKNLEGLRDGKMVSYSQFSEIKIPNPNPKEQQKIANTISSLDELIKEQVYKIEQLKLHKKGLMQGLFPKVKN
ncbi:restriction endonuclease subunit S [Flavobacterium psychrotolerans]|uniref:Restriction endonuclease subunit S n=1 Tax=Flavobacterium psychrotolerans TaxID=2169410 RepID=A0A2U1JK49_9FLAO|nr:restriction endonuclease subunit S [Flavobacterium psychrotolerans]PWA05253.1 restriction endonuclease subunit S [Flavobacterium psychrotolerans]